MHARHSIGPAVSQYGGFRVSEGPEGSIKELPMLNPQIHVNVLYMYVIVNFDQRNN